MVLTIYYAAGGADGASIGGTGPPVQFNHKKFTVDRISNITDRIN